MERTEYVPSVKVIFSDRGSIYFGILIIAFMVFLSVTFFIYKFQKKTTPFKEKVYNKELNSFLFIKHKFILNPSRINYLLFFSQGNQQKRPKLVGSGTENAKTSR